MDTIHKYTISIRFGSYEGEDCYESRVKELPDIAEYADTAEEAYALAIDSIEVTTQVLAERGRVMPEPQILANDYSGRVTLRLPKSLHRALVQASEDEGVSLNSYMTNVLTYYSGFAAGTGQETQRAVWMSSTHETQPTKPKTNKRSRGDLQLVEASEFNEPITWRQTG